ncbi:hypothetical protein DQ237_14380 [Blastococcus sp. TF02-8]|uniref:hypothetical protein n=1 Tax=Blastococcus sp. TF02-8 TaxID=2250574 RepID=UPI000DE907BD|nr:hypothetical protein [Blastococcus sp. TF02-8]RBY95264.1 hypothetical protein DQ237_14380 [Blastococcus sp. TF02-8]
MVESGFGSVGSAALHAGFVAHGVELTAQFGELLAQSSVLLLVTGTQVVDSLVAMGLLALGVVYGGVALGGHRGQVSS